MDHLEPDLTPSLEDLENQHALLMFHPQSPPRQEATISDLQQTMGAFMAAMDQRMRNLEQSMMYVQRAVEAHTSLSMELRNVLQYIIQNQSEPKLLLPTNLAPYTSPGPPTPDAAMSTMSQGPLALPVPMVSQASHNLIYEEPQLPQQPTLSLSFDLVETKWFTERPYPTFRVRLLEDATGQVYRKTTDWQVTLHLFDGNGNQIDDKLGEPSFRTAPLQNGEAEFTGLKFSVVSSKNGNFFVFEAELTSPEYMRPIVKQAKSANIVILSCRLFHNPKRALDALAPDDQLSKMPGIGRLYAERFAAAGIHTIRQLASIDLSMAGRQSRLQLLAHLRRDKGTMTESKLSEYVDKALDIIRKSEAYARYDDADSPPQQSKRFKFDSDTQTNASTPELPNDTYQVNVDDFIDYNGLETHSDNPALLDVSVANHSHQSQFHTTNAYRSGTPTHELSTIEALPTPEHTLERSGSSAHRGSVRAAIQFPLHNAIGTNDITLVKNVAAAMIEGGLPLHEENLNGWTPLMLASAVGNLEMVRYFCSLSDSNAAYQSSVNGMTALHVAACEGHNPIILHLLRQPGVNAGLVNTSLYTPLMMAVAKGRVDAVRTLSKIADSFRPKTAPGIGLYHLAALSRNVEVLKLVHEGLRTYSFSAPSVKYGNLVWNEADDRPLVPSILHCAAYAGGAEVVEWLLSQRVLAQVVNGDGWTPLHFAAYRHHPDCVKVLARHSDVNAVTSQGWTALSLAAMTKSDRAAETVKVLVTLGAESARGIPANLVSVSTGNMSALEALHEAEGTCLKKAQIVEGMGQVTPMEVGKFFNNEKDVDLVVERLQAKKNSQTPTTANSPANTPMEVDAIST